MASPPSVASIGDSTQQLIKKEQNKLALFDEYSTSMILNQVQATHAPDGREFDVRTLLEIVEDIFNYCESQVAKITKTEDEKKREDNTTNLDNHEINNLSVLEPLSFVIDELSCEISHEALSEADPHTTTMSLLRMLSKYSWDSKLVMIMLAFALNYGEFLLIADIYSKPSPSSVANAVANLMQVPLILDNAADSLKATFEALNNLINRMRQTTKLVVEAGELSLEFLPAQDLERLTEFLQTGIYWTVRSVVACATKITKLASLTLPSVADSTGELVNLAEGLARVNDLLGRHSRFCSNQIDERMYQMLLDLNEKTHSDNMHILKVLINPKDEIQPLVDMRMCSKTRESIDFLRKKNVLLLISDLPVPASFEQEILDLIFQILVISMFSHTERMESSHPYVVVWIPVVSDQGNQWKDTLQKYVDKLEDRIGIVKFDMLVYTVYNPTLIQRAAIRFFQNVWHFKNKPILVVLDPHGKVLSRNALHMMWIWGIYAFPFTTLREKDLWQGQKWIVNFLVYGMNQEAASRILDQEYLFLYGGDNVEWLKDFSKKAKEVSEAAEIQLKMAYLGKSYEMEKVKKVKKELDIVEDATLPNVMIWLFWNRLKCMLFSKIQLADDQNDPITCEIKKLLSYDKEGGWALLTEKSEIVLIGHRTTVLRTLTEYDQWKAHVPEKGFHLSFKEHHDKLQGIDEPCWRLEFPSTFGEITEPVKCPKCSESMEKHIAFRCCHDSKFNLLQG